MTSTLDPQERLVESRPETAPDALGGRLGWVRAAVLGANDGIVSVAGVIVGVAGATPAREPVIAAGLAALVAGAASMALGEYVSVAGTRDGQLAALGLLHRRQRPGRPDPARTDLARPDLARPWQAAGASAAAFVVGAVLPLAAAFLAPEPVRVLITVAAVILALACAGAASAALAAGSVRRSVLRVVIGGALGLSLTYGVGWLFGAVLGS